MGLVGAGVRQGLVLGVQAVRDGVHRCSDTIGCVCPLRDSHELWRRERHAIVASSWE